MSEVNGFYRSRAKVNMKITKENFNTFNRVRESGKVNMLDTRAVMGECELSEKLIGAIIKFYDKLDKVFNVYKYDSITIDECSISETKDQLENIFEVDFYYDKDNNKLASTDDRFIMDLDENIIMMDDKIIYKSKNNSIDANYLKEVVKNVKKII